MGKLFELVDKINSELKQSNDLRLQAAINMAEARKLVDKKDPAAEGLTWTKFAMKHFDLSRSEVKKLVKIGSSDDPEKAMADHREKNRISADKSRKSKQQKGSDVGAQAGVGAAWGGGNPKSNGENGGPESGTVNPIINAYEAASDDARERFRQWLHDIFGYEVVPCDPSAPLEKEHRSPAQAMRTAAS